MFFNLIVRTPMMMIQGIDVSKIAAARNALCQKMDRNKRFFVGSELDSLAVGVGVGSKKIYSNLGSSFAECTFGVESERDKSNPVLATLANTVGTSKNR
jgi:hypothetical protein